MFGMAVGKVAKASAADVTDPCLHLADFSPEAGETRLCCFFDADPCCRGGGSLVVCGVGPGEDVVGTSNNWLTELRRVDRAHSDLGVALDPFEFAASLPIRLQVGGVGGPRLLGMLPRPALRPRCLRLKAASRTTCRPL